MGFVKIPAVRLASGLMTIDARIGWVRARAVIDTGAERSLGNLALRDALRPWHRAGKPHEFIWDMKRMLELGQVIGTGNVGLLLDCWHWYTSGGTVPELLALRPEQVVYVHVNDAPAGIDRDAQVDNVRCLPGETGVIDIVGFLQALQTIGYDGPVLGRQNYPASDFRAEDPVTLADVVRHAGAR